MDEAQDEQHDPTLQAKEEMSVNDEQEVISDTTENDDVAKNLYDAEEFLANFSELRLENDQLKRTNDQLQIELEKAREELEQMVIDKSDLEAILRQERDHHKEELWKVRGDLQKIQEERLLWKEKYLDIYMKNGTSGSGINIDTSPSGKIRPGKRKQGTLNTENEQEFYSNLSTSFGLTNQDEQPVPPITNQLWDPETKRFECKECKATFRMFTDLQTHVDKNKCVKYTFQCPQCSMVFSNATSFTKHLKYHMSKTVHCDFCGEKFMHEKGLRRHIKMYHTEFNQRYQCQYCSKIFNRKSLLENHIRRHFDFRPFKCNECDKSFKTKQYLTGHVNGVHKNDKQFVCGKCDARFSWRTTWKRHMQNHILKSSKKKNKKRAASLAVAGVAQHSTATVVAMSLQQQIAENVVHLTNAVPQLDARNLTASLDHSHLAQNIVQLQAVSELSRQSQGVQLNQQGVAQLTQQPQEISQLSHNSPDVSQLTQRSLTHLTHDPNL